MSTVQIIKGTTMSQQAEKAKILRACAYGRVSTDEESQELSYTIQQRYYAEFISSQPDMEFVGFYGDEAISGTNRIRRTHFNRMMEDAKAHRFDIIYTKSLSRFARNTLDALTCIRELKSLNPPVYCIFEKENLHTGKAQNELILTIMSAIAQEESRSISENIKWSLRRKFQNGEPMVDLNRMIGYDKAEDGSWAVNESQAEIVRFIYSSFADGCSACSIAKALNKQGKTTVLGNPWRADAVLRILRSEKYIGNVIMQKTITPDFLTHKSVKNTGEHYLLEGHHVAIIGMELYKQVQQRLADMAAKRTADKGRPKPVLSNLFLPDGTGFSRLTYRAPATDYRDKAGNGSYFFQYPVWKTKNLTQVPGINRCYVLEISIQQSFMEMLYRLKADSGRLTQKMNTILIRTNDPETQKTGILNAEIERVETEQAEIADKGSQIYQELVTDMDKKLEQLKARRAELISQNPTELMKQEYRAFLSAVMALPDTNAAGGRLIVNTVDCDGSLFSGADGTPKTLNSSGYRKGGDMTNTERISTSPDFLPFNEALYLRFVKRGVIKGDHIEYEMSFGMKLVSVGNGRTLRGFLGWKRIDDNGIVELLDETWKVNNRSISRYTKKKE